MKTSPKPTLELRIRKLTNTQPRLLEVKQTNNLIREVWKLYGDDVSAPNIFRIAGALRTEKRLGVDNTPKI